jgi:dCMP deaminase
MIDQNKYRNIEAGTIEKEFKWDQRFLQLADLIGQWSKDESTKVGAVIVDPNRRIISAGYNGFPQAIEDDPEKLKNRELKYKMMVHAEINALLFAERSVKGCTLYTTPFLPCSACASMFIQAGISRVVSYENDNPRWAESISLSTDMFLKSGIRCVTYGKK